MHLALQTTLRAARRRALAPALALAFAACGAATGPTGDAGVFAADTSFAAADGADSRDGGAVSVADGGAGAADAASADDGAPDAAPGGLVDGPIAGSDARVVEDGGRSDDGGVSGAGEGGVNADAAAPDALAAPIDATGARADAPAVTTDAPAAITDAPIAGDGSVTIGPRDTASADGGSAAPARPFGSRPLRYAGGAILPTGAATTLDDVVRAQYARWRAAYLRQDCGGYYVASQGAAGTGADTFVTVSEAHGYGMMITALMAGAEPEAQQIFDGLATVARKYPSINNADLMAWGIDRGCQPVQGADSATDGDLDRAFALLLAEKQWGRSPSHDYGAEARQLILAIQQAEMNPSTRLPLLGDWSTPDDATFYWLTRPSDFLTDHYRAFAAASASPNSWQAAVDGVYALVDVMQTQYAPQTGLVPDFIKDTNTTPKVVPLSFANDPKYLGEELKADYDYNSCRVPWRLGTDFVVSGDARARTALARINAFIRAKTGDDPARIVDGYSLAGVAPFGGGPNDCFTAGFGVAALIDASNQGWADAIWNQLAAHSTSDYYGDTVRLLALIVMSGNWWAP